jgi:hypothetical protein
LNKDTDTPDSNKNDQQETGMELAIFPWQLILFLNKRIH